MLPNTLRTIANATLAALLLTFPLALRAQQVKDSPEISQLMSQAEENARLVAGDADQLVSYTRSQVHWKSHAQQLELMRAHVNDLIGDVNQLRDMASQGSPWQQQAIERIDPLMQEMADQLTSTILHLREHQNHINLQPYQDYVRGNQALADKTLAVIQDYVDYGGARADADSLEQKLNLASEPEADTEP